MKNVCYHKLKSKKLEFRSISVVLVWILQATTKLWLVGIFKATNSGASKGIF